MCCDVSKGIHHVIDRLGPEALSCRGQGSTLKATYECACTCMSPSNQASNSVHLHFKYSSLTVAFILNRVSSNSVPSTFIPKVSVDVATHESHHVHD